MAGHGTLTASDVEAGIRNPIQHARIRRTRWFFEAREAFMVQLVEEVSKAVKKAKRKGFIPVFRLNGTSDIRWELIPVTVDGIAYANIMTAFPTVQFYDYTKLPNRKNLPANYHLTFSLADGNDAAAAAAFANGYNIAAVFRDKVTVARYETSGFNLGGTVAPVANGDETDLRFLDPANSVIALYAKGNARRDTSGFVRD
jgi:hypothetical protein